MKMGPQGVIDRTTRVLAAVGRRDEHQLRQPAAEGRRAVQALAAGAAHADRQRRRDHRRQRSATSCSSRATRIPTCGRATARWSPTRWTWPAFPTSRAGSTRSASRSITDEGYFYHKYNPDGSPASVWHPWVLKGQRAMPIQEDETALVVWALWRHYYRYRDIEFIRPLWVDVVQKAADFMVPLPRPAHRPAAAELRPVGRAVGRPRVHRRDGLRRAESGAQLRRLLRRSRTRRALQQGRRGDQGRRGEVSVQRQAQPLRPPARAASDSPKPPDDPNYEETDAAHARRRAAKISTKWTR